MRTQMRTHVGLVHAVVLVASLTVSRPPPVHASGHLPAFRHSCARASASVAANSSQQRIKNEATGRRVLCMLSERAWQRLPLDAPASLPLLTVKPSYPPPGVRGESLRAGVILNRTQTRVAAASDWTPDSQLLPCECTCDDVHDLKQRLLIVKDEQRALARSVYRLESVLTEVLETIRTTDDVAFLERQTCAVVVYNEQLTRKRELRLLREELKKISGKYGL